MTSTAFSTIRTGAGGARVMTALRTAAERTGVAFDYLVGQASLESGLNPLARSASSSATGLFQFIDQTWLATVKKHGASHGLAWAADAIESRKDGRLRVDDPSLRQAILDLRKSPETASAMAAEFASDNRHALEQSLGRTAEPVDLYLAHFLGAGGATQFLRAHDANPDTSAALLLPRAAQSNRSVFFHRDGSPRSVGEIRSRFAARIGEPALTRAGRDARLAAGNFIALSTLKGGGTGPARAANAGSGVRLASGEFVPLHTLGSPAVSSMPLRRAPSPQLARLAYLMLAEIDA